MKEKEIIGKMKFIFGSVFLLAQRWQCLGDWELSADKLTTKQWLLLATIETFFQSPPTLSEITDAFGTSRQNVKQIALNLEKRGFIEIKPDENDRRILRFSVTQKSRDFWNKRAERDIEYISSLFEGLTEEEIDFFYQGMLKLSQRAEKLCNQLNK